MPDAYQRAEGDVNLSQARRRWQMDNLSAEARQILDADQRVYLQQSMSTPCLNVITAADGIYIEDIDGRRMMDFHGNSVHQVGYNNRYVIEAVKRQLDTLSFLPRRFTSPIAVQLADKLTALAPGDLNKVLLTPSGTAAVGLALKLARKATGRFKTLSTWDAFHGAGLDAISVGGEAVFRSGIGPLLAGSEHFVPYNSYRPLFGHSVDTLDYVAYMLEREPEIGAVILEPIRCTDVHIPPRAYFTRLRQLCDRHGALLIFDEIPTAFGRSGAMFVHEHFGITPDIVVIGKGFGGGIFPMAGIIASERLDIAADVSLGHYTHEKSAVGCAAALATIQYIEQEQLVAHAAEMGRYLHQQLHVLMDRHLSIGDVRVIGMMAAIELVTDRQTREKADDLAERIMYRCMSGGLSFKVSGGNILTLTPPLIASRDDLARAVAIIDQALSEETA